MGRFIWHLLVWTVGIVLFLGLLLFGITERWDKGGTPIITITVIVVLCLIGSYVAEAIRGKKKADSDDDE